MHSNCWALVLYSQLLTTLLVSFGTGCQQHQCSGLAAWAYLRNFLLFFTTERGVNIIEPSSPKGIYRRSSFKSKKFLMIGEFETMTYSCCFYYEIQCKFCPFTFMIPHAFQKLTLEWWLIKLLKKKSKMSK